MSLTGIAKLAQRCLDIEIETLPGHNQPMIVMILSVDTSALSVLRYCCLLNIVGVKKKIAHRTHWKFNIMATDAALSPSRGIGLPWQRKMNHSNRTKKK